MVKNVYSVRDGLIGFRSVIVDENDAAAVRGFTNTILHMLSSDESAFLFVDDLSIWRVGTFDLDSGQLTALSTIEKLADGKSVVMLHEVSVAAESEDSNA